MYVYKWKKRKRKGKILKGGKNEKRNVFQGNVIFRSNEERRDNVKLIRGTLDDRGCLLLIFPSSDKRKRERRKKRKGKREREGER